MDDLQKDMSENPAAYTQWFKIILEKYFK